MNAHEEAVALLIDAWKLFVPRLPTGTVSHGSGVAALLGNVPLPFFNLCAHDSPMPDRKDLRRRLDLGADRAARCPFPWMFALCEEWAPADWQAEAAEVGLAPAMPLYGMATDRLKPPRRPLPDLDYRRVRDLATARDIAEVNGHAYGMPPEMIECLCNLHLWKEDTQGYVGYRQDRPVTASAAFPVSGTVYIGFVATLPGEFGKGYAEAVMRHSIEQGRRATGFVRTVLHATEAGRPLYDAMGYEMLARFTLLSSPHDPD